MKRFILILMSLLMAASLCACGGDSAEAGEGQVLAGKDAGNEAVHYSFAYPESWELVRNDGTIELQIDCNEGASVIDYATITVQAFSLNSEDSDLSAEEYWDKYKSDYEQIFVEKNDKGEYVSSFKQLDLDYYGETATPDDTELPKLYDSPAIKVKYSGTLNERTYISDQIICCRYGSVYFITLVVPEAYYENVSSALTTIKESFVFQD